MKYYNLHVNGYNLNYETYASDVKEVYTLSRKISRRNIQAGNDIVIFVNPVTDGINGDIEYIILADKKHGFEFKMI